MHRLIIEIDRQLYQQLESAAQVHHLSLEDECCRRLAGLECQSRYLQALLARCAPMRPMGAGAPATTRRYSLNSCCYFFVLPAMQLALSNAWSMIGWLVLYTVKR